MYDVVDCFCYLANVRKTSARMGGLSEERSRKGRGRRKVERKCQQQGAMKKITKVTVHCRDE